MISLFKFNKRHYFYWNIFCFFILLLLYVYKFDNLTTDHKRYLLLFPIFILYLSHRFLKTNIISVGGGISWKYTGTLLDKIFLFIMGVIIWFIYIIIFILDYF